MDFQSWSGNAMLEFLSDLPEDARDGAPLVVLLHGRGSHEGDLMGLRPHLPREAMVVAPRAPFPAGPWGYGAGWAWYRFISRNRPEPNTFEEGMRALEGFIEELPAKLPVRPGPLVLGGFSQGGTCSLAFAMRNPGRAAGILNFSGFLADHPSVRADADTVRGTRFFWGHGTQDPNIPFDLAIEGRGQLSAAGADLETHDYAIGHWIDPQELSDAMQWLQATLAGEAPRT